MNSSVADTFSVVNKPDLTKMSLSSTESFPGALGGEITMDERE